ncbi:Hypothetical protein NTJ_13833 [Nesidiocoris tenuis]|uniref:Uncharacterized protein n=1 Tax=Nesidiocoris tenuis TaxID=355587 RepID=A0ABN7B9G0_9HEMI|nr:Hypothetical protein NTJ_13833 [Nesidiocoris tenuis]
MTNEVRDSRKGTQRWSCFLDDVDKCMINMFNDIGADEFKNICAKTLRLPDSEKPAKIKDKMAAQLRNVIAETCVRETRSDLELSGNNVTDKLQTLCDLEEKFNGREIAWRPPYDPVSHCRSGRVAATKANLQSLQVLKSMKRESIEQLMGKIRQIDSQLTEKNVAFQSVEKRLDFFEENIQKMGKSLADRNDRLESALD